MDYYSFPFFLQINVFIFGFYFENFQQFGFSTQGPDELFEVISQCFLSALDRDCLSGWGAVVHVMYLLFLSRSLFLNNK